MGNRFKKECMSKEQELYDLLEDLPDNPNFQGVPVKIVAYNKKTNTPYVSVYIPIEKDNSLAYSAEVATYRSYPQTISVLTSNIVWL